MKMTPKEFVKREQEIIEAQKEYPGIEVGEAYRRFKADKGENAVSLNTDDLSLIKSKEVLKDSLERPCDNPKGCDGTQVLESVCSECTEGKAGFKSKWICTKCLFTDLSKREYMDWLDEFASRLLT
jgi:hypothetical protein